MRKFEVNGGDKFNKWTAIKFDRIDKARNNRWFFRCKCGTNQSLPVPAVINGRTKSCRYCKNSKNLKGKKFGNWKVIKKLPKLPEYSHTKWLCRCKCGNEVAVDQSNLVNKISKQCNECRSRVKIKNKTPIPNKFWAKVMYRAGDRKINWNLTEEEAWDVWLKQSGKCRFTGLDLSFDGCYIASVDRINCSAGYSKDNIQWVYKKINLMKNILNDTEFIELCCLIAKRCGNA